MKDVLKHEWISRMTMAMCATHPDVERSKIESMVAQIYAKRVKDTFPKAFLDVSGGIEKFAAPGLYFKNTSLNSLYLGVISPASFNMASTS